VKHIRLIIYTLILTMLPCLSWAQTNTDDYIPYRDVEATDSGIVVTYIFRGGIHQSDPLHEGAKFWKIPGFGLNDNATEPGFPFRWDSFVIPDDAEPHVTLLDSAYTDTIFTLAPAYPPLLNSDTIGYTAERVPSISPYTGFCPSSAVEQGDVQYYRGQGIVRIATLPIQYNIQTGIVRNFSMIRYLVSFTKAGTRSKIRGRSYVSERADNNISISDHFLENTTLNYRLSENGRRNIQTRTSEEQAVLDNRDYLIISTPTYTDAVNRFAEWKRTKGFRVHILLRNDWTVTSVKTSIMELYNANDVNLYYVLFIGGVNDVPAYANSNNNYHVTDYYYGCMEDTILPNTSIKSFPSVKRGRISVQNEDEAIIVIDKIINFEENPPIDYLFYENVIHCSYFQDGYSYYDEYTHSLINVPPDTYEDRRFTLTSEEIKDYMESYGKNINRIYYAKNDVTPLCWNNSSYAHGDSIPSDLRRPNFEWSGNYNNIINKINDKAFYVLYRGHGNNTCWGNPYFAKHHINQLDNGNYLPIVFSISCLTGNFNIPNSFSESFLKKSNGGCVSIFGASQISYSGYNDCLIEGMFEAIWPNPGFLYHRINVNNPGNNTQNNPIYDLGSVLDYGFLYLYNFNNSSSLTGLYTKEIFHLFGDPSMMIYTNQPSYINNPLIRIYNNTISVQTTDGNARISFYTTGTVPIVDSYFGNHVDYTTTADSVIICIDRHNCIPYVVTYHKNEFIQNENISDSRTYVGKTIKVGSNVTTTKPEGDVIISGADVLIQGGNVELQPGTVITNSNVLINP